MVEKNTTFYILWSCVTILEYKIAVKCELNTHGKLKKGLFLFHKIFSRYIGFVHWLNTMNRMRFLINKNHSENNKITKVFIMASIEVDVN